MDPRDVETDLRDVHLTHDSWSSAQQYERFMGRWSRLLAPAVVSWLAPPDGLRWLDVGCGTGALSGVLLSQTSPRSVVGIDPSPDYVALAAAQSSSDRATFRVGAASNLPLPDSSVDGALCGLALNFVPDVPAALRDISRVLVAGGVCAAYVWDYGERMQMLRHFWDAAIAEDAGAAAFDEGARFPLCRSDSFKHAFVQAGLEGVVCAPVEVPTVFAGFDDYWTPFLGGQGPAPGYCAALPAQSRERLRARLANALPPGPDGTIRLVARAWAVRGTAPEPEAQKA